MTLCGMRPLKGLAIVALLVALSGQGFVRLPLLP
jgi:hypothetical protein